MKNNSNLNNAKSNKMDEFYTQYDTIEKEIESYSKSLFENKIILCPCDNFNSNFTKYFKDNFEKLKLKKLICTSYNKDYDPIDSFLNDYNGTLFIKTKDKEYYGKLKDNGDFSSNEVIEYIKECDIIVTNPPFSLFRKFFDVLSYFNKDYILLCNQNCFSYNSIFRKFMNNEVYVGNTIRKGGTVFEIPEYYELTENCFIENNKKLYVLLEYVG